jgi:carboxylesterase type B
MKHFKIFGFLLATLLSKFSLCSSLCDGPNNIIGYESEPGICAFNNIRYGVFDDTYLGTTTQKDIQVHLGPFSPIKVFENPFEQIKPENFKDEKSVRCLQLQSHSNPIENPTYARGQFDCFALHIRTKTTKSRYAIEPELLPVAVFIHGGMFQVGAADDWAYESSKLSSRGLVVVSINYRLNVFGFLGLNKDTWNNGVRDQRIALEWIKKNIKEFGGNPEEITVFGESAGATSTIIQALRDVHYPKETPIIKRIISQSNPIGIQLYDKNQKTTLFNEVQYEESAESELEKGIQCLESEDTTHCKSGGFLKNDKCTSTDAMFCTIRRITNNDNNRVHLLKFMSVSASKTSSWKALSNYMVSNLYAFGPTIDYEFLIRQPMNDITTLKIPVILGTNREEGFYFPDIIESAVTSMIPEIFEDLITDSILFSLVYGGNYISHDLSKYYINLKNPDGSELSPFEHLGASFTDYMFYCPTTYMITPSNFFIYQIQGADACTAPSLAPYDCNSRSLICIGKSCHANEVPTVFGTWNDPASCCEDSNKYENMTKKLQSLWTTFFIGNNPWEKYKSLIINKNGDTYYATPQSHSTEQGICDYFKSKYPTYTSEYKANNEL